MEDASVAAALEKTKDAPLHEVGGERPPAAWDWRAEEVMGGVRDQGQVRDPPAQPVQGVGWRSMLDGTGRPCMRHAQLRRSAVVVYMHVPWTKLALAVVSAPLRARSAGRAGRTPPSLHWRPRQCWTRQPLLGHWTSASSRW